MSADPENIVFFNSSYDDFISISITSLSDEKELFLDLLYCSINILSNDSTFATTNPKFTSFVAGINSNEYLKNYVNDEINKPSIFPILKSQLINFKIDYMT